MPTTGIYLRNHGAATPILLNRLLEAVAHKRPILEPGHAHTGLAQQALRHFVSIIPVPYHGGFCNDDIVAYATPDDTLETLNQMLRTGKWIIPTQRILDGDGIQLLRQEWSATGELLKSEEMRCRLILIDAEEISAQGVNGIGAAYAAYALRELLRGQTVLVSRFGKEAASRQGNVHDDLCDEHRTAQ